MGGERSSAGQDEAAQGGKLCVHVIDFGFQTAHLRGGNAQGRVLGFRISFHVGAA